MIGRIQTIIFDVDGTLIDSNAAHAETWAQAFTEHGVLCTAGAIRPLVGMGADKLLPMMAGVDEQSARGQAIAQRKRALFGARLSSLSPTPGARALVAFLRHIEKEIVIATSAGKEEMRALLQQAGVEDLVPQRTSKDDAAESKPDPDIVHAALSSAVAPAQTAIMIGDTPYDIEAARGAGVDTIALRCGGHWSDEQLHGAMAILDDPASLLAHWRP